LARARTERITFAKIPEVLPLPDLLSVQHDSFGWFLERGLKEIFEEISPIEDFTGTLALELTDHRFEDPTMSIEEAKERDSNYSRPLFVTARFMNRQTGEIKEQQVFLGDFPMMTPDVHHQRHRARGGEPVGAVARCLLRPDPGQDLGP